jgi:tight adherence protein B
MLLILFLVFLGTFSVAALLMLASTSAATQHAKQALATLDSALANENLDTRMQVLNVRKSEQLSAIPWLNRQLQKLELAPRLQRLLAQAEVKWTAGTLMALTAALALIPAYLIEMEFSSLPAALGAGVLLGAAPLCWVLMMRKRRFGKFEAGLPEALDMMVNALRAGHSLIAAMGLVARESAAPVGTEFRICFDEQNYGLELNTAMDNLLNRMPIQDLRIVATAIMIQKESGGNLAEVLDKTSYVIRQRFRLKRQVMTHTAQGRLTGAILTALPVVLGIAIYFVNPVMMSILWKTAIGVKLMWTAAGMIAIGGLIIRKIVNMEV